MDKPEALGIIRSAAKGAAVGVVEKYILPWLPDIDSHCSLNQLSKEHHSHEEGCALREPWTSTGSASLRCQALTS